MPSHFTILSSLQLLSLLSVIHRAASHGFVHSVEIGNQSYPGWNPFSDPYANTPPRVVRKVLNDGFVAASDPDLACHHDGNNGTGAVAEASAGSQVVFQWDYWPADHQGPVSTYMTSCNGDCTTFLANDAKWFKVDASGYFPDDKQWAADKLRANNNSWVSTIPVELAQGQYLMRNEIVALHSVTPQFYPSCTQLNVSGTGTGQPSADDLMTMQQVYSGVNWPDIYTSDDLASFTVPGPPPVDFGDGKNVSSSKSATTTTASLSASAAQHTASAAQSTSMSIIPYPSSAPSGQCALASRRLVRAHFLQQQ